MIVSKTGNIRPMLSKLTDGPDQSPETKPATNGNTVYGSGALQIRGKDSLFSKGSDSTGCLSISYYFLGTGLNTHTHTHFFFHME